MLKTIFVGNLPYSATEAQIRELFEPHGPVHSAKVIMDRETGRSRGFGFVEMDPEQAHAAIESLNGQEYNGRNLLVNEAREREQRGPRRPFRGRRD
ncbi:MAG: RNA-binding protein [Acidobacteria bacterium]|nr:RNA-binding protein [Acidobacteriota bacterium]MCB9397263.1 RNA-binding protein [Acidobacteriota bacterium]